MNVGKMGKRYFENLCFTLILIGVTFHSLPMHKCKAQAHSNENRPSFLQTHGEKLITEKKYNEAIKFYLDEIQKNPKDITAHYNLAVLYYNGNKFNEALKHIDAAISLKPEFPLAWFIKGEILIKKSDSRFEDDTLIANIIECFDNALKMESYSIPPSRTMKTIGLSWKASLLMEQDREKKNLEHVISHINEALALSDSFMAALLLIKKGIFQYYYSYYDGCLVSLNSALSRFDEISSEEVTFPEYIASIHNMKGIIHYKQKKFQRALEEYNQAIFNLEPSNEVIDLLFLQGVYSNKGLLYTSTGQFQEALNLYSKVDTIAKLHRMERMGGSLQSIWTNPSLTLYRMGKKEEAFNGASGHQIPYEGIKFLFSENKIYLAFRGATEFFATYFLSSPVDFQDPKIKGKRPIELSSTVYLDNTAITTMLDDLILPDKLVLLPPSDGSLIVSKPPKPTEGLTSRPISYYNKTYAYVIGINNYQKVKKLYNAVEDAKKVYNMLKENYNFNEIKLIINEEATRDRLHSIFEKELSKTDPEDGVFIFYAGHGVSKISLWTGKPIGYIIPVDGEYSNESIESTCISMSSIKDKVEHVVNAKHVLIVLDCCYSGLINRSLAENKSTEVRKDPSILRKELQDFSKKRVFQYITAGDEDEEVPDVSIFMKYFLEALDPKAGIFKMIGLKEFTSREVYAYLLQPVLHATDKQPQKGSLIGNGEFIFAIK